MKLDGVPDVSRFIRRTDKVPLNNTVKLILGEVEIEANGLVLALKSKVLEEIVSTQRDIFLDNFVGEEEGVQDVLEILYGGDVKVSMVNIKTIVKFSVLYNIGELYRTCYSWLREHPGYASTGADLYEVIQLALLIESIDKDRSKERSNLDLTDLCKRFITRVEPDKLHTLSRDWDFKSNVSFIKFLIQADILHWTLPILTDWINDDSAIRLVLDQIELKNLARSLGTTGPNSGKLMQKMNEAVSHEDLIKRVRDLQLTVGPKASSSKGNLKDFLIAYENTINYLDLEYYEYQAESPYIKLTTEDILSAEDEYGLNHFEFVDILLRWILKSSASDLTQPKLDRFLGMIRRDEVNDWYLGVIERTLKEHFPNGQLKMNFPELKISASPRSETIFIAKVTVWSVFEECYDAHGVWQGEPLEMEWECEKCAAWCNTKITFIDRGEYYSGLEPCYEIKSGFTIEHAFMVNSKNADRFRFAGPECYESLIFSRYQDLESNMNYLFEDKRSYKESSEKEKEYARSEILGFSTKSDEMFAFVYKCTGSHALAMRKTRASSKKRKYR